MSRHLLKVKPAAMSAPFLSLIRRGTGGLPRRSQAYHRHELSDGTWNRFGVRALQGQTSPFLLHRSAEEFRERCLFILTWTTTCCAADYYWGHPHKKESAPTGTLLRAHSVGTAKPL